MQSIKKNRGVNLIELMVTVAIISIIAAIALPSYTNYVTETNRAEGTSSLMRIMDLQERYYLNQFPPSYTTNLTDLGLNNPQVTENGNYSISAAACGDGIASCVQLTATAMGSQVDDGDLVVDSVGNRTRDGNPSWD